MRGFFKLLSVLGLVILVSVAPVRPAHALQIVHDPTTLAQMIVQFAKQLLGFQNALGSVGVGTNVKPLGYVEGKPVKDPCLGVAWKSQTEYFEKCFKPWDAEMRRLGQTNTQEYMATLQMMQNKMMEAQNFSNHRQKLDDRKVSDAAGAIGRAESFCDDMSLVRSRSAHAFIARARTIQYDDDDSDESSGAEKFPEYAKGPNQYWQKLFQKRKTAGVISCTGSDGTYAKVCGGVPDGTSEDSPINADEKASTLLETWMLGTEAKKRHTLQNAQMWIDNVFDRRAISPIRADKLEAESPEALEAMGMRTGYNAKTSLFMLPFNKSLADRTPSQGMLDLKALKGVVDGAQIPAQIAKDLMDDSKVSRATSDYLRYSVWMNSADTQNKYAGETTQNLGNAIAFIGRRGMDTVSLLYDIRQELRTTNMLLGALGGLTLGPNQDAIEGRIQALAAQP